MNSSSELTDKLSEEEGILLLSETAFRKKDYKSAATISDQLCSSVFNFYKHRGIRIKANSLIKSENLDESIKFIVWHIVIAPRSNKIAPIKKIVERIDNDCRKRMQKSITLPIIYNLYSTYINDKYDYLRNYAYEDFLISNGIAYPSELRNFEQNFNKELIIYFLQSIAIESVMDSSTFFESSQDVAKERLNVCRYLIELDERNIEIYQEEIKDINRRLMLQQRIQEIERSKIYVDIENIKKKISGSNSILREGFNRYIAFLKNNYEPEASDIKEDRIKKVKYTSYTGEEVEAIVILPIPDNEMTQLFESLFIQLRDEYVSSNEHGLDAYLSVRIRHGTLGGQLRSHLESLNLITQRDSNSQRYKDNEYWVSKFKSYDSQFSQSHIYFESDIEAFLMALNEKLAEFSQQFDNLTHEIITTWIQVRRKTESRGLFNFIFDKRDIQYFSSLVTSETTFEEFFDFLLEIFEGRLKGCLKIIRQKFDEECKSQIIELLTDLQSSVEKLGQQFQIYTGDITYALGNARTSILTVIDRIIEWFTLSKSIAKTPFQLEDAVRISEASVRTFVQNFSSNIITQNDLPLMEGVMLNGIVDIFFIIFENIVRHSGVKANHIAHVKINYIDNVYEILVENKLENDIDIDLTISKLSLIKEGLTQGKYISAATIEGGTGFYKIMKILKHDFGLEPKIDFGINEERSFYVIIKMKLKIIEVIENEYINS